MCEGGGIQRKDAEAQGRKGVGPEVVVSEGELQWLKISGPGVPLYYFASHSQAWQSARKTSRAPLQAQ